MKKLVVFLFLCLCLNSFSQKEKISRLSNFDNNAVRYGFYLGLHTSGFALQATDAKLNNNGAGFQLGVLADLKLSEYFSLLTEPGVISNSNTLIFAGKESDVSTTYFTLPVSLKIQTRRVNNIRGFVLGGVSYNYNFTYNRNNNDNGANDYDFQMKRNTFMGQLGIGASFYFPYFKFSPSIRTLYGFENEFIGLGNIAKSSISELSTRGVMLTLTFQ